MAKSDFTPRTDSEREFKKVLESIDYSKNRYNVFCDWLLCTALAFAQISHFDQDREKRYLDTIGKYKDEKDRQKFAELAAITANAFTLGNGPDFKDFLGNIYMICGFGSNAQGQFFTPYNVCQCMAGMLVQEPEEGKIFTCSDPAVGGGALPIAYAEALYNKGVNYQQYSYFECWDISQNSCCISMIQMSILGMPATIVRGNSLTLEVYEVWETPFVGMHLIKERLRSQKERETSTPVVTTPQVDFSDYGGMLFSLEEMGVSPAK